MGVFRSILRGLPYVGLGVALGGLAYFGSGLLGSSDSPSTSHQAHAAAETQFEIELPCQEVAAASEDGDLHACGKGSLIQCKELKKTLLENFEEHATHRRSCLYQGKDVRYSEMTEKGQCTGADSPTPLCNLAEGQGQDLNDPACGTFSYVTRNALFQREVAGVKYGSRERSYFDGALIQAMKCHQSKLESEIQAGKITISGACMEAASAYRSSIKNYCALDENNVEEHCNFLNVSKNDRRTRSQEENEDLAAHGNASCKAASAQQYLTKKAFFALIECEWLARSQKAHEELLRTPAAQAKIEKLIKEDVIQKCVEENYSSCYAQVRNQCDPPARHAAKKCKKKLKISKSCVERQVQKVYSWCQPMAESQCIEQKGNECYGPKFNEMWLKYLQENLPDNGKCEVGV